MANWLLIKAQRKLSEERTVLSTSATIAAGYPSAEMKDKDSKPLNLTSHLIQKLIQNEFMDLDTKCKATK